MTRPRDQAHRYDESRPTRRQFAGLVLIAVLYAIGAWATFALILVLATPQVAP